jgi:hypothetical protein
MHWEELALQGGEGALSDGVVVGVAARAHRWRQLKHVLDTYAEQLPATVDAPAGTAEESEGDADHPWATFDCQGPPIGVSHRHGPAKAVLVASQRVV